MAVTTVSDLNSLYNTIYERALFVAREMNMMAALVDNRSATGRMNRVVPIRPQATAVTVGETEDFNAPTTLGKSALATLTPSTAIAQAVITDADMETDPDSAVGDATFELGSSIGTKIDTDLAALFDSFTTDKGDGASNTATMANIGAGIAVLGFNHARQFGKPNVVLHPYHWHDIWTELGQPAATYTNLQELTTQALRDYYVSNLLACNWFTCANIAIDASDDAVSGIFSRPALMLDTRRAMRLETERDASLGGGATELNMTAVYAVGVVRQTFGIGFTADATEPA